MPPLSPTKKARLVRAFERDEPPQQLAEEFGIHLSTVYRTVARHRMQPDFYAKSARPGRPKKMSKHDVKFAVRKIDACVAADATDLQRQFFPSLSPRTVRRHLSDAGLPGRIRRKVPFINPKQRQDRVRWADTFYDWPKQFWEQVVFSDESKFLLIGSDGRRWCRRRTGDALDPRFTKKEVKHGGGSIMVWGCITSKGVGRLYRVTGKLDAAGLVEIYREALLGTIADHSLQLSEVVFQQDNDPKHTSEKAWEFLRAHNIDQLPWPPSSPDLNIIEHVWDHLDKLIRSRQAKPANLEDLWTALEEEW